MEMKDHPSGKIGIRKRMNKNSLAGEECESRRKKRMLKWIIVIDNTISGITGIMKLVFKHIFKASSISACSGSQKNVT